MPHFSEISKKRRDTCHPDLIEIVNEAIRVYDFRVTCGHRGEWEQSQAYASRNSKVLWPDSAHNKKPSEAIDIAPYPISWDETIPNLGRFYFLAGVIKNIAAEKSIAIKWGGDWDGDGDFSDQTFNDLVHFELIHERVVY